jgi:integrase
MSAVSQFSVRTVVFENGERMPVLVNADTGMPVFDACVYASTEIRPKSGSSATLEQALRSIQLLLIFVGDRAIDLRDRFSTGRFLELHEIDDLVRTAYRPLSDARSSADLSGIKAQPPKVVRLDRIRSRAPAVAPGKTVAASTVAIRLYYLGTYLEWYGKGAARHVCRTLEQKNDYMRMLAEFLDRLRARTPNSRSTSTRLGLTPEQKALVVEVTSPSHPENPWEGEFVRIRNQLIVLWGLGTGLRRGELLGLRIRRIDLRKNMAEIVRRPDDKHDKRSYQPNTKTRERSIDIGNELAYLTHQYIVKFRATIRGAQKHDFLFVADRTGDPLSLAGMSKVFRQLRTRHPLVGEALSSHVLRHTWNDDFSEIADKANLPAEHERRARNHAMGWSEHSNTADHYLKRRNRRQAAEVSVRIQEAVLGGADEKGEH